MFLNNGRSIVYFELVEGSRSIPTFRAFDISSIRYIPDGNYGMKMIKLLHSITESLNTFFITGIVIGIILINIVINIVKTALTKISIS